MPSTRWIIENTPSSGLNHHEISDNTYTQHSISKRIKSVVYARSCERCVKSQTDANVESHTHNNVWLCCDARWVMNSQTIRTHALCEIAREVQTETHTRKHHRCVRFVCKAVRIRSFELLVCCSVRVTLSCECHLCVGMYTIYTGSTIIWTRFALPECTRSIIPENIVVGRCTSNLKAILLRTHLSISENPGKTIYSGQTFHKSELPYSSTVTSTTQETQNELLLLLLSRLFCFACIFVCSSYKVCTFLLQLKAH